MNIQLFIRKRTIIAIIITILAICGFKKYWFIYSPMPVDLDITGKGHCNVEIVLNKTDSTDINLGRKENVNINLDKTSQISVLIKKISKTKKFIIVLTDFVQESPITLSNINLNNGKKALDMTKFNVEGARSFVRNNKLVIQPDSKNITLLYQDNLDLYAPSEFDYMLLIIITVLTYLLAYKLANYIADFNTLKGKPKTDILFLLLFFAFLFIPMSHINTNPISKKENRSLAKWKPIVSEYGKFNFSFGTDFNEYFNDRFSNRENFINTYYTILSLFSKNYYEDKSIIYNKKADFSYNKLSTDVFMKKSLFTDKELDTIKNSLTHLKKYCDENNVKLYLILSSDKETIYPEFYPTYYKPNNKISRQEQLKKVLKTIPNLNIISTRENILKEKDNNMLFFPYDTHLNSKGLFIEYNTIISEVQKTFPNLRPVNNSDYDLVKAPFKSDSTPPKRYLNKENEFDLYYVFKKPHAVLEQEANNTIKSFFFKKYTNKYANNNIKITIIGDSFHDRYIGLLAETFAGVNSLFVGFGYDFVLDDNTKQKLFGEKPDILFIETTERFLQRFLELDSLYDVFEAEYRTK